MAGHAERDRVPAPARRAEMVAGPEPAERHAALERRPEARAGGDYGRMLNARPAGPQPTQRAAAPDRTGLPGQLKSGVEALSGMAMDDVRVHYNSAKPAQLDALAYAQGSDIHLAPGQEQHLPHEAWHLVQQAQGRVKPTLRLHGGTSINDDAGLEREADMMGARALAAAPRGEAPAKKSGIGKDGAVQRAIEPGKLNVAGEVHDLSADDRKEEKAFAKSRVGGSYWQEGQYRVGVESNWSKIGFKDTRAFGDPFHKKFRFLLYGYMHEMQNDDLSRPWAAELIDKAKVAGYVLQKKDALPYVEILTQLGQLAKIDQSDDEFAQKRADKIAVLQKVDALVPDDTVLIKNTAGERNDEMSTARSVGMHRAANTDAAAGVNIGIWKVGQDHVREMSEIAEAKSYALTGKDDFQHALGAWREAEAAKKS